MIQIAVGVCVFGMAAAGLATALWPWPDLGPEPGGGLVRGIGAGITVGHAVALFAVVRLGEGRAWARRWVGSAVGSAVLLALRSPPALALATLVPAVGVAAILAAVPAREGPHRRWSPGSVALLASSGSGWGIALGGSTPIFDPWFAALGPDAPRTALLEEFPLIGAHTAAQLVLLAGIALHAGPDRPRAAAAWIAGSIAAWFVVDSTLSVAAGGAFNVAMVNLPTVAILAPIVAGQLRHWIAR